MANVKITDLGAYTNPVSTDVLPIVDVGADVTKKVSIADLLKNASAGTAAAPGIAFDGDNTGIYSPGADQVAISTNGTGRLFIDSSGRLGLGTSSPSTTNGGLDIASGGISLIIGADGSLSSRTNATNKQARIAAYHYTNSEEPVGIATVFNTASSNAVYFGGGTASLNAATALEFYTAANTTTTTGTQRMVIDSSGRLGLGTSSPQDLFHVEGASSPTIRLRTSTLGSNASPASTFVDFRGYNQEIRARIEVQDRRTNVNGGFLRIGTADNTNTLVNAISIDNAQQVGIAGDLVLGPNNAPAIKSDTTGVTGADQITNMMSLTQAEYDAIVSPDANTFYVITA